MGLVDRGLLGLWLGCLMCGEMLWMRNEGFMTCMLA
jgi:hypothetical protein